MATYREVDATVLGLAADIISHHHPDLLDAKVGFIFQEEAGKHLGKVVLGNATKVSDKQRAVGLDLDFIITIALDYWQQMELNQKRALLDHELCHCDFTTGEAKMRGHDIEEFQCIIDRYGLWKQDLVTIAASFQAALPGFELPHRGMVMAVEADKMEE